MEVKERKERKEKERKTKWEMKGKCYEQVEKEPHKEFSFEQ